ncbi:multidrug resistance-associated protein 1-like isoform X2 [Tachypleus tridentatus]|uniref:multidrug resistance-associated protein 1-like isoform X2 n=1 Tax=Tachypleus tridentatus TaxID=6853 RepID=UPI003FD60681
MIDSSLSEEFCFSPFWDLQVTWYTNQPDFTPCFHNSILIWIPCIFLWLLVPVEVTRTRKRKGPPLPWTLLTMSKLLFCLGLIVLTLTDLIFKVKLQNEGEAVSRVEFCSAYTKIITFVLVFFLILRDKRLGRKSSGVLFLYWFFLALCGGLTYRSIILQTFSKDYGPLREKEYIIYMVYYPLVLMSMILAAFNEKVPYQLNKIFENQSGSYFHHQSFMSRLLFLWVDTIVRKGYKEILSLSDIPVLMRELQSRVVWLIFEKNWSDQLKKVGLFGKLHMWKPRNIVEKERPTDLSENKISLSFVLFKSFWPYAFKGFILDLIYCVLRLTPALILNFLIDFVSSDEPMWRGLLYGLLLFVNTVLANLMFMHFVYFVYIVALQVKSALIAGIYRKALHMSSDTRRRYTVGELVNFMAVDAEKVFNVALFFTLIWGAPIRITLAMILLWQYIGPACLAGVATLLIILPLSVILSQKTQAIQEKQMCLKDSRLKFINEILSGIKVLKLYAWETPFMKHIFNIRNREVKLIKIFLYLNAVIGFLWNCAPFMIALASFVTYVLMDEANILDASTAFVSLTLLNMIRFTLILLPELISSIVQTRVSLIRLNRFLVSEEADPFCVGELDGEEDEVISMDNASVSWSRSSDPILKNIKLHVRKGQLVAVVGQVGTGKSSLLLALLGEMYKLTGSINLKGSVAYVPQQAWIQNCTVRQNILFKSSMNNKNYQKLLDACSLRSDLLMLPGGDQTELGEKGVNLSGGQKQRISLARAVYQNTDIYLLDDPLSAVDSHVAKHIFRQVIGPKGLLQQKTRLLVTHNLSVLPEVDYIIVMRDGSIEESGNYDELIEKKGVFAELVVQNLTNNEETESILEDNETRKKSNDNISEHSHDGSEDGLQCHSQINSKEKKQYLSQYSHNSIVLEEKRNHSMDTYNQNRAMSLLLSLDLQEKEDEELYDAAILIQQEKMEVGKVKSSVYIDYLYNMSYTFAFGAIFSIALFQVCEVGANLWLSAWSTDEPMPDGTQNIALQNWRLTIYGLLGAAQGVSILCGGIFLAAGAVQASRDLHNRMIERTFQAPMSFFDTTPIGRILNRFGKDVDVVDTLIPIAFKGFLDYFFALIGAFVVISLSNPIFIVAVIPFSGLYYLLQRVYLAVSRQLKRLESVTRSPIYNNFSETISGTSSIRAYKAQDFFIKISEDRVDTNSNCYFQGMVTNRWLAIRLDFLSSIIVLAASLLAVFGRDSLSPGIVGLSLSYALNVTEALTYLIRKAADLETRIVSVERIDEYNDLPSEVGIVGRTGAGKSSLTLSLFRIIEPVGGSIIIDGVDISDIGLHDLRSNLTIIPQDPVLYTGPLRINLDPNQLYTDEEVWRALEHAHLKPFVSSLAQGLKFQVSEGGENMSLGQRQLVCLARALLRKSKVLVLDEATAAVDLETDKLIQNTIQTEFSECTVITIAHRLHTILDYNRIIVMEKGKIVETGNPSTLLSSSTSIFYSMAKDANLL